MSFDSFLNKTDSIENDFFKSGLSELTFDIIHLFFLNWVILIQCEMEITVGTHISQRMKIWRHFLLILLIWIYWKSLMVFDLCFNVFFISVCFKVFDGDHDSLLSHNELQQMVEAMVQVRNQQCHGQVRLLQGLQCTQLLLMSNRRGVEGRRH